MSATQYCDQIGIFRGPLKWWVGVCIGIVLGGFFFVMVRMPRAAPTMPFRDLNGHVLTLQQFRGRPVLINFWSTSCPGCIREMPHWIDIYRRYHDHNHGVAIVAVAMSYDTPEYVKAFAKAQHLPFTVVWDADGSVARAFGDVKLTPTTMWIDRSGHWVETSLGEVSQVRLMEWLDRQ